MADDRRPSGLPRGRIIRRVYGPQSVDVEGVVEHQHSGFVRARRVLLVATVAVAVAVVVLLIVGRTSATAGMAGIMPAPLVIFLAGAQVAAMVTRPKPAEQN